MTVWDRIGIDQPFRIKGGRVWWDYASHNCGWMKTVRLDRMVVTSEGLRIYHRYVDPETEVVEVKNG